MSEEALAIPFSEIPIGTVLSWYSSTTVPPPRKYLFCDGSVFTENQYPYLYQILTASGNASLTMGLNPGLIRTPDLRGLFVRGYDPERRDQVDRDPGRTHVGHIQTDAIKSHWHRLPGDFLKYNVGGPLKGGSDDEWLSRVQNPKTDGGYGLQYGDREFPLSDETRPINANLAFIIRAEI